MGDHPIGEIARRTGFAPSAIRYYERIGLLPPARRVGGKRRYGTGIVARLEMIRTGKALGFSLEEIGSLVDGLAAGERSTRRLQELARSKLPEVEATLSRARLTRRVLRAAASCDCRGLAECLEEVREMGVLDAPRPGAGDGTGSGAGPGPGGEPVGPEAPDARESG